METIIAPSILSADFSKLGSEIEMINKSEAQWIHVDIMDGMFVPNITFGPWIVRTLKKITDKVLDVHLMVEKPDRFFEDFRNAGADILTVHYEACTHLHRSIQKIKSLGMKAGVSVNPHIGVNFLEDIIPYVDLVLIMSVNPGFGGQKFIESSYSKIERLKELISIKNLSTLIEVDGGVSLENAVTLIGSGANVLVSGNAIFRSENPLKYINDLAELG
ncbi:MAG: ribulose-phosphate 3-epimerase [Saprospiraceae bacterium]|nr:ribulose-phosphate 3-epimerase [Saprospiraceae bacterium]